MHIKIETDGVDAYEVEVKTRDIVVWEMAGTNRGIEELRAPSMTTIYQLAHVAVRRVGKTDAPFAAWAAMTDVEVSADVEDPTLGTELSPGS